MSKPVKVWAVKYEFQMGNGEWAEAYIVKRHLSDCHEIKFEKGERNIRIVELTEKPERCITVEMLLARRKSEEEAAERWDRRDDELSQGNKIRCWAKSQLLEQLARYLRGES